MSLLPSLVGRFRPSALFMPDTVAVIGAATSTGAIVVANMIGAGFKGVVLPVAADVRSVSGVMAYPDVAALPTAPDLAVLAQDGDPAPMLADLARRGVGAVVCLRAAPDLAAVARQAGMRVVGPHAFGICVPGIGLNASTAHLQPAPGRVALVSQSASLCRTVLDWAGPNGVGFSHVVGLGDAADMGFAFVLDWLSRDPGTGAILLDIRSIRDRRAFLSAARAAARLRPVVAIHSGERLRDPSGQSDRVFDAALRRAGVLRVTRLADLLAAAETLTRARPARTERLAIVSNAVGPGRIAADATLAAGLSVARPDGPGHEDGLTWISPETPGQLAAAAQRVAEGPDIGGVLAVLSPVQAASQCVQALIAAARGMKVPLLACALGEATGAQHRQTLAAAGVPSFSSPELAVRGFEHLVQARRARQAARELPPSAVLAIAPDRGQAAAILAAARAAGRMTLLQDEALAVLAAYGLGVVSTHVVLTEGDALRAAASVGFPVVLKLRRSAQPKAGGPGGVSLDLRSDDAVRQAMQALAARRAALPADALAEGFLLQRQVGRTRELRVRMVDDAAFGPALGFGQGGSAADLLGGMAWDLPPLNLPLAHALIARAPVSHALTELHDLAAADVAAVADGLVRISQLLIDFPEIGGLDLNPVFSDHAGIAVADAWIALRPDGQHGRLAIAPYPAELGQHWTAGTDRYLIRPIRPEDAEAHAALFQRLSPEDVRLRFFSALRALPPEQVVRMTQVDYDREMAFVAVRESTNAMPGETVGVARLVREGHTSRGEFAVVVQPDMKGRGLARRLMEAIIAWGRGQGMTEIVGQVLAENAPMLAFVRRLGFTIRRLPEDPEVVEARLAL